MFQIDQATVSVIGIDQSRLVAHCLIAPLTVNRNQACTLGCALKKFHTSPASK